MNVFVIPSWYPTEDFPTVGIFLKEQAELLAKAKPEWNIGVSLWGSHEPSLWLKANQPLQSFIRLTSKFPIKPYDKQLFPNCVEIFHPAFTWSRKIKKGNIKRIIAANRNNLMRYEWHFGQVDIIHAHVSYPAGEIAKQLSEEHNIPFVLTEHMSPFPLPSFKKDFRRSLLPSIKRANSVVSVSHSLQSELAEHGIVSHVIPNPIDTHRFIPKKIENEMPQILAVGRLEKQKGYDLLINAMSQLKNQKWQLSIIGVGSERKSLEQLIQKNGLKDRVKLMGDLSREAVVSEMQRCDFFILSSRHESFGMVAAEAMACGKPVVFTKCGGVTDELDESVGLATEIQVDSLAHNIDQMLQSFGEYDSEKIRDFVEIQYSPQLVADQLDTLSQDILSSFRKV
jgi:glycosyltransferase involved in cell wall biosynthesis